MACSIIRNRETNEIEKVMAPNGKESVLFNNILNSIIDKEQALKSWAQVYTPSFKAWFGDWEKGEGSKVVDSNGEPLLVYHGTGNKFDEFDKALRGETTGKSITGEYDSENAFFFSNNENVSFNYAIMARQKELTLIANTLSNLTWSFTSTEQKQKLYNNLRKESPKFAKYIDDLKSKGLDTKQIMEKIKELSIIYNKLDRNFGDGGSISNPRRYYRNVKEHVSRLIKNKENILQGNYDVKSIYDDDTLRTTNKYNKFLVIYDDGLIVFDTEGYRNLSSLQRKKITDLSSSDFDKLMDAFLKTVKEGEEQITNDLKKGGFTPELMPVFLNAKNIIKKDFKGEPFVMQMDGTGAANEASKLTLKAKEEGKDGVVFENIRDPELANNYGVFEPNQIKSLYNEGGFSTEENNIYAQSEDMPASKASDETVAVIKNAAKGMDIDIVSLAEYTKGNPDIETKGINGLADLIKGVVAIAQGMENYSLTEEIVHVATAILEQTNPKIVTAMIAKIDRFKIYDETLKAYKGKKAYQLSNGKPDIRKIKKEAVDKLISELIINQSEGSTEFPELMEEKERSMIQSWWDSILDFIRGIYAKTNIDIFEQTANRVVNANVGGVTSDIIDGGIFYQVKNSQVDKIYDTVKDFAGRLKVVGESVDALGKVVPRHYKLDDLDEQIPSVTAELKKNKKMPERTDLEQFLDNQKKDWGTEIHDYVYNFITNNLIDKDGYKRVDALTNPVSTKLGVKIQKRLNSFATELINSYDPGTRFILEAKVVNQNVKGKLASAIDFMAISPYKKEDGSEDVKVDILDWKTTSVNKSRDEDINWAKQKDWKAQMGEYTKILYNYGLKPSQLRKARMIPFVMNYNYVVEGQPESGFSAPTSMEIGKLNSLEETNLYLLPVPINSESTGNPKIDSLIKSLREQWDKLYKKPVAAEDRYGKILEINKLSAAIRNLHVKLNFEPLVNVGNSFLTNARTALDDFANIDYETITKEDLDKRLGDIIDYGSSASKFTTMDQVFLSEYKREGMSKENIEVLKELEHISSMASRMLNEISTLQQQYAIQLGLKEGITTESTKVTILNAEVEIDGMSKTFLEGSRLSAKIIKLASNLLMNAKSLVNLNLAKKMKEYESILIPLEREAAAMGKNAFDLIGTMSPTGLNLIKKLDSGFWKEITEARQKEDKQFFLKNMDVKQYDKLSKEAITKGIEELNKTVFASDPEEDSFQRSYKITKLKDSLDIHSQNFDGYDNYRFKQLFKETMIEEGHYSKEYEQMRKSKAALDVWQFFTDLNTKAKQMGYLDKQGSSFFPLIEATILQKFAQTEDIMAQSKESLFTDFYQTRINEAYGMSKIDPETGQVKKQIPKYFTKTDKNINQLSTDLNKIGALWVKSLLEYESSKNLENTLLTLHSVEKAKGSLIVENGVVQFTDGDLSVNEAENKNAAILRTIIDDGLYQLGQDLSSIGNIGITTFGEKVGKDAEDAQAKAINAKKLLSNADTLTRSLAVGLKPLISIANFMGYNFQAFVNGGQMYSFSEFQKNNLKIVTGNNFSTIQRGLLDLFVPLNEDVATEERRKLAKKQGFVKYLSTWTFSDVMMSTNSFPERKLQFSNALSIIDNSMVKDGKIVNIRQYLKEQDRIIRKGMSESERKALEKSFDERAKALRESSSLDKIAKIENEEIVIPGVSDMELAKFRTSIIEYGRKLNGQMNEDNKAGYRRDAIFTSFMMFKNWIPKLVSEHASGINKNVELNQWEYGRTRAFFKTLSQIGFTNIKGMIDVMNGTDAGLKILSDMLEAKRLDYFKKTGQQLEITEEEFYDLMRTQLDNQKKELLLLLGVLSLMIMSKASEPPEDATEEEKNRYKWYAKLVNKVSDEITFYYNPLSFESMTKGSVLPSLGLMSRASQVFYYAGREMYGEATDDEDMIDKTHPTKYLFNMIPVVSQIQNEILPYLYPDLAKEQGIRVTTESRR